MSEQPGTVETDEPAPDEAGSPAARRGGRAGARGAHAVRAEVAKAVVGQEAAVTGLVIALLCRGHVLVEGVPGVAKTLLVRALAAATRLESSRVQFTPDLMPGRRHGLARLRRAHRRVHLPRGPRLHPAPPRGRDQPDAAEDAGLAAGGDGGAAGHRRGTAAELPEPFVVVATQNPVEYEGTYPLPEAQLDRFLLKLRMPLPPREAELEVLARHAAGFDPRDLEAAGVRPSPGRRSSRWRRPPSGG